MKNQWNQLLASSINRSIPKYRSNPALGASHRSIAVVITDTVTGEMTEVSSRAKAAECLGVSSYLSVTRAIRTGRMLKRRYLVRDADSEQVPPGPHYRGKIHLSKNGETFTFNRLIDAARFIGLSRSGQIINGYQFGHRVRGYKVTRDLD